jgi:hypothetical protein
VRRDISAESSRVPRLRGEGVKALKKSIEEANLSRVSMAGMLTLVMDSSNVMISVAVGSFFSDHSVALEDGLDSIAVYHIIILSFNLIYFLSFFLLSLILLFLIFFLINLLYKNIN